LIYSIFNGRFRPLADIQITASNFSDVPEAVAQNFLTDRQAVSDRSPPSGDPPQARRACTSAGFSLSGQNEAGTEVVV
jgi:hypothetical protein